MYSSVSDFATDWQYEVAATGRVLAALTDASLAQPVAPGGRTLGMVAWHIVQSLTEMPHTAGVLSTDELHGQAMPTTAQEIYAAYQHWAPQVTAAVTAHWTDDQLRDKVPMYGDTWAKGTVLSVLIRHQAHHRGQLTVLMRQAGLRVPGVYGPAREEWADLGISAPA
ncbi:putative damage-inducible protein DinB [Hymenobacter luteus]|uniref:Damage-inducible protein DinB n=2 Tax=Hymenobacter TaxID=89966 RepID=A0ABR6JV40_9BACT|nr:MULTISPECIES: DinB family protein [Hymenobacter]MBB4600700.1 putative damage-inducible protein DinB [Hymenobacter latericoloratus]MBB6059093.1 putative damage-inducible protein DinB [Hymenobacter luteus]